SLLAISYGAARQVQLLDLRTRQLRHPMALNGDAGGLRFQKDAAQLITASLTERMLYVFLCPGGQLVTKLSLAIRREPGAMAVSPTLLFVANSKSSDVSILNIETRRVIAVAPAGANPGYIAITPDNQ